MLVCTSLHLPAGLVLVSQLSETALLLVVMMPPNKPKDNSPDWGMVLELETLPKERKPPQVAFCAALRRRRWRGFCFLFLLVSKSP